MSNVNISNIQSTGNQAQDMQNLFDAYARLRKELIHGLSFLDEENVPIIKDIIVSVGENTSSITVLEDEIILKVDADGVIAAINLSPEGVTIQGTKINLVGAVTVLSDITGNLGTITAGTINGVSVNVGSGFDAINLYQSGSSGILDIGVGSIVGNFLGMNIDSAGQLRLEGTVLNVVSTDGQINMSHTPYITSEGSSLATVSYVNSITAKFA